MVTIYNDISLMQWKKLLFINYLSNTLKASLLASCYRY